MAFTPRTWGHQHHRLAPRRQPPRRRFAEPRLERLEDRTVLSTVTTLADGGPGSLRQAILDANANPNADVIDFAPKLHGTITLTGGELAITQNLTIVGPGPNKLTISGNDHSRVFYIQSGKVTIAGLTITDGLAQGLAKANDRPLSASSGGGIVNFGTLTLSNDVLSNNQALGATGVSSASTFLGGATGGGVANLGTLTAIACQFINNQALGAEGNTGLVAGSGIGGGIANPPSAVEASVIDCLFAGNVARGGSDNTGPFAGAAVGGGISNASILEVTGSSTFRHNQAIGGDDNFDSTSTGVAGLGVGGAISSGSPVGKGSTLTVIESSFDHNQAIGGNGNRVFTPPLVAPIVGLNGGGGGAITVLRGSGSSGKDALDLVNCTLDHNLAVGGQGAAGSDGGNGAGGGLFVDALASSVIVTVSGCTVDHNDAIGGPGGSGGSGGDGGDGVGGGLASVGGNVNMFTATLYVSDTTVDHNTALGGDGVNGGNGWGGGLYNGASSTLTLTDATVQFNFAVGGSGRGGSDGEGIGGGVYNLGFFAFDPTTVIKKNHASTSNDDIFS